MFEAMQLALIFTPDGMAKFKAVCESAKDRGGEGIRERVFAAYPWAQEVLEVALARDPEGAYQYICEVAQDVGGPLGSALVAQYRNEVYQIYAWLQGEMDKPRPEIPLLGKGST